jgi:hypothetical protein
MILPLMLILLLSASSTNIVVTAGVIIDAPTGYVVSNLDPALNSTYNGAIYGPNFIPGFEAGLTNTSIFWKSGSGYAKFGYSVGPWAYQEVGSIPHFAVGAQCCNFKEVPHTQQFSKAEWGDHYYSRAGLGPPGINVENYTAVWGEPTSYVGLRTDWDWTVQFSFTWNSPVLMNPANEWGAIGIAASQYVKGAPGDLVYTLVNFWMDSNSSGTVPPSSPRIERSSGSRDAVVYHPVQIGARGNQTIKLDISPYLEDTIRLLGLTVVSSQPPVIPYIYMNVEGYNFGWNTTLWSFRVMTPSINSVSTIPFSSVVPLAFLAVAVGAFAFLVLYYRVRLRRAVSPSL